MNLQNKIIKKISFIVIVSILSLNFSFLAAPQRAEATGLPVVDLANLGNSIWEFGKVVAQKTIGAAAHAVAMRFINNITAATVSWINGSINGGKPGYPASLGKLLDDSVNQSVGDFIQNSSLSFLCDPFRLQVKLALQLDYGTNFQNIIGCTLSKVKDNINNAYISGDVNLNVNGNSINVETGKVADQGGGWNTWLQTTQQPQNNPIGAYLVAKAKMDADIVSSKNEKTIDILNGQGAISFKKCVDTYREVGTGKELGKSSEYTDGAGATSGRPPIPAQFLTQDLGSFNTSAPTNLVSAPKSSNVVAEQNCTMKTPGSTITAMLGMKANNPTEQATLQSATANGIDTIFSALINALMTKAINQLNRGALDNNTADNNAYDSALNSAWTYQVQANSDDLSGEDINWGNAINNVEPPASPLPEMPVIDFGSTTFEYPPSTGSTTIITSGGSNVLDRAKNNANILINSLKKSESSYQNTYNIAKNILTQAKMVFATSSVCNLSYNRNDSILRSLLIRANVTSNIDGVSDSNRNIASIPWNLKAIDVVIQKSSSNLAILNTAAAGISAAGSVAAVTDAMIPVNSTAFDTDPQPQLIANIKFWVNGVGSSYNSTICPINLSNVLNIVAASSTTTTN